MAELIELTNISRVFNTGGHELAAISNISLQVNEGETLAIEGASGSGKSTLLSIIGLLDQATSGDYSLKDYQVAKLDRVQKSQVRNRHIGWIFQNFNLIGNMTAIENVALPLRYNQTVSSADYQQRSMAMLQRVGLQDKAHAYPNELSGGQQQRVAIARALVNQPSLLLADEPTGNLDSATSEMIIDSLMELPKYGATVILVTHDERIAAQCQKRIKLADGKLIDANQ